MVSRKYILIYISILILFGNCYSYATYPDSIRANFELGLPNDNDPTDDYLIMKTEYTISYNYLFNSPNWAAWKLNSKNIGKSGRYSGKFVTDISLPDHFQKVTHDDYTNSGFDRGHIVRSHDRSSDVSANKSTFFMTNIIAQTPDLNRGVWLDFERFCQDLAENQNKELFIYAGATYNNDLFIGNGIKVPDSCYKIVLVLEKGEGIECVGYNTKIYSVMIPNIVGIRNDKWQKYATSVDHIENSTGYNYLCDVDLNIQGIIEQIINKVPIKNTKVKLTPEL